MHVHFIDDENARRLKGCLIAELRIQACTPPRYIRDEPVKSVLIAAACGAGLVLLLGLLGRSR